MLLFTQWRQLKAVKTFIRWQVKRSARDEREPLPENKSLHSLKLTPLNAYEKLRDANGI